MLWKTTGCRDTEVCDDIFIEHRLCRPVQSTDAFFHTENKIGRCAVTSKITLIATSMLSLLMTYQLSSTDYLAHIFGRT